MSSLLVPTQHGRIAAGKSIKMSSKICRHIPSPSLNSCGSWGKRTRPSTNSGLSKTHRFWYFRHGKPAVSQPLPPFDSPSAPYIILCGSWGNRTHDRCFGDSRYTTYLSSHETARDEPLFFCLFMLNMLAARIAKLRKRKLCRHGLFIFVRPIVRVLARRALHLDDIFL